MKNILLVYERMMTGGTTTALLSLLNEIDYNQYSVDLLLFDFEGEFFEKIPQCVNVLQPAAKNLKGNVRYRKILKTILNGSVLKACLSYLRYRNTNKGNLRLILMHYGAFAQVSLSRKIDKYYDVAIGFIEGWADHYVLSKKIKAEKKIVWFHPDYINSYLIPEADRKVLKKASSIIVVSKQCEQNIVTVFPEYREKVAVIENITANKYIIKRANEYTPSIKKGSFNLCTVARCDIQVKGLDRIIYALSELKKEGMLQNIFWHYIGEGPQLDELKRMVKRYDLENNVIFYGQQTNPLVYLKQMDLFILGSRYEGKPIVVEEAIALEKPCLVTEYASAKEQVIDGVTGMIVNNSDRGVYEGLKLYINSEYIRVLLKQGVKQKQDKKISNEIEKLYRLI